MRALKPYKEIACPDKVHGMEIDVARGFDVTDRSGKVYEHFISYTEAEEFRAKKRGILRYWLKEEKANA